ncbi:MAG: 30S ribosomal protein S1, partial [Oscillospiraceae bacterium]|nr:30S ribosomal protein S1 [Oscillospiraceae bacterium]
MSEEIRFDETIAEQETQEATAAFGDSANIEVPVFGGLSPTEESQAAGAQPEAPVFEGMSDSEQDMGHQIPETLEDSAQTEVPVYEKSYSDALESVLQEAAASETVLAPEAPLRSEEPQYAASADSQAAGYEDNTGEVLPSAQETFEEMLEKSIKTLHTGEKVTGIVTSITSTEVSVDLGTKQSGYIPISEFTDNTNMKIEDVIKIGDSIETFVMRVNDVEGMVMLSKKRLDAIKNWDDIEAAKESKAVVEGIITEENKGGVVVSVKGVRVFVPASQTGLPKSAPMSDLMKKTVRLRITEVNQSRRRVVGSIRAVLSEERREKSDQLWNDIEVNKQYSGVVKSMTSYGVFVDIGGVDGMIHISELSWTRIKQPSEVMSIGDEVSVYVLSFDKDNRKISLGYKKNEDNPWMRFISQNAVGDIVNVKIVKMMPFGAFAEICPGVDGLIHISQITDHRIGLPSEVLSDGQLVDVKITEIDKDRRKVSLSIRALIDPSSQPITEKEALDAAVSDKTPVVVYDTEAP